MDKYILHFFQEKTRDFDYERLLSFFDDYAEIKADEDNEDSEREFRLIYENPILFTEASFIISNKSTVKELYKLDPRYFDINFRIEIPVTTSYYSSKFIFEIVEKLVKEFDFYVYNSYFEDVIEFRIKTIERSFELTKENFREKFGYQFVNVYQCSREKLNDIYKYVDEQYDIQRYYRDHEIYVPNYNVLLDDSNNIYFAVQWQEGKLTVFPPHIDYVYYVTANNTKTTIIPYAELIAKIERHTTNVPGFLENTKVIELKQGKRVARSLKRAVFTPVEDKFRKIKLNQLIDF